MLIGFVLFALFTFSQERFEDENRRVTSEKRLWFNVFVGNCPKEAKNNLQHINKTINKYDSKMLCLSLNMKLVVLLSLCCDKESRN